MLWKKQMVLHLLQSFPLYGTIIKLFGSIWFQILRFSLSGIRFILNHCLRYCSYELRDIFFHWKVRQLQNFNITVHCFNLTYFYEYISPLGMDLAGLVCLESWGERLDIKRSSFFCNQVFFLDVEGSQLSTLGACWEKIMLFFALLF